MNAICPVCQIRYYVDKDTRGYLEIIRCKDCPEAKVFQQQMITSGDQWVYKMTKTKRRATKKASLS